jgi:hypothetical protein
MSVVPEACHRCGHGRRVNGKHCQSCLTHLARLSDKERYAAELARKAAKRRAAGVPVRKRCADFVRGVDGELVRVRR